MRFCHFPVDHPYVRFTMVALFISRLVISICSLMVFRSWGSSCSVLCYLRANHKNEEVFLVEICPDSCRNIRLRKMEGYEI
nr:hypothetical protein CKAN_01451700 [Ipomoea batatas]